ncbi:MAG TPA: DUF2971 domain-containing protein [Povalibacter sp.]|jgi:hypothetical protein|nr:DUF2971 domain-containing protein [Povalibacter sp.]
MALETQGMKSIRAATWNSFYKYGSLAKKERLRAMIRDSHFYFPCPSQLNDPCDCRNQIHNYSAKEIEEFLIEANRVYYGHSRGDAYIRDGTEKFGAAVLLGEMATQFNKIMDSRYGVFSLTKRPNNMAMWAKYADDHKGYCLEFADLSTFANVFEVTYAAKVPLALTLNIEPGQADFLFTKSADWSNEEEARILSLSSGIQQFPPKALSSIILGEHCCTEDVAAVKGWISECKPSIRLRRAKFNVANQELEYLTI